MAEPVDFFNVLTGQEFDIRAKCVINATGPFTDSLRKMDNQETKNICQPSAGVHIVIPGYYRCCTILTYISSTARHSMSFTATMNFYLSCGCHLS